MLLTFLNDIERQTNFFLFYKKVTRLMFILFYFNYKRVHIWSFKHNSDYKYKGQ